MSEAGLSTVSEARLLTEARGKMPEGNGVCKSGGCVVE